MPKQVDFAISYAGEDAAVAREICQRLRELTFEVFFAEDARQLLVGVDGEDFFERLFAEAKQVVVLISQHYRRKDWPRFEWDVICERSRENRFVPIRLDDTKIKGLPSSVFYLAFTGDNWDEIVDTCVQRLLLYERDAGIRRASEYEQILDALTSNSRGALAQAYQLVKDKRRRAPLADCLLPDADFRPCYEVVEEEWCDFSVVRRRSVKIVVRPGLSRDELRFNLKHCAASQFNAFKPDAIMVFAYWGYADGYDLDGGFTAGRAVFAPFGRWEDAQDGVAYNTPTEEFDYSLDFVSEEVADVPSSEAPTGAVIQCDLFAVTAHLEGDELRVHLDTDLPDAAQLMVSVCRSYKQSGDAENDYPIDYYSRKSIVGEWRTPRIIPLDDEAFVTAVRQRVDQFAAMGEPFEVAAVDDAIELSLVVPVNQEDPAFGERNVYLRGKAVTESGKLRIVRYEERFERPLRAPLPLPYRSKTASFATLEVGKRYRLSAATPLMPELNPDDPLAALARMRTLPPRSCIQVKRMATRIGVPWYCVDALTPVGEPVGEGWINSTALIGQGIEEVEG